MALAVLSTSSPSSRPVMTRLAEGERAEHQGTVRDRLVARHAHGAGQARRGKRREGMGRWIGQVGIFRCWVGEPADPARRCLSHTARPC